MTPSNIQKHSFMSLNPPYCAVNNTHITIINDVLITNNFGSLRLSLPAPVSVITPKTIYCNESEISPSKDGLLFKIECSLGRMQRIRVTCSEAFSFVSAEEDNFTVSTIDKATIFSIKTLGTLDSYENIVSPCKVSYKKIKNNEYFVDVVMTAPYDRFLLYEVCLK